MSQTLSAKDVAFASGLSDADRFQRISDGHYVLNVADLNTDLELQHVRRERYQLCAELTAHSGLAGVHTVSGILFHASVNLSSIRERESLARTLQERTSSAKVELTRWRSLVDELGIRAHDAERTGRPAVVLRDVPKRGPERWIRALGFTLPENAPAMIFSDGDSLKTMTADALAIELAHQGMNVLIADWEMTASEHEERVARLCGTRGVPGNIAYLDCARPLLHERERIADAIHEHQSRFLVCDSAAFACHDKPESADAALVYFREVRRLGVASLHIAHTTKGEQSDQKPFGSTFWFNSVRALWYAKRAVASQPNISEVGFYPRKFNFGQRPGAHALRFTFGETATTVKSVEAASIESLASALPLKDRIRNAIKSGARSIGDIASELDAKPDSVKRIVNRHLAGSTGAKVLLFAKTPDDRIGLYDTWRSE